MKRSLLWFVVGVLVVGFLFAITMAEITVNNEVDEVEVDYEYEERLLSLLPEIKSEVNIRFIPRSFNASKIFKFSKDNNFLAGQYRTRVIGKPIVLVNINQTFEEVLYVTLHEFGHHSWNYHLTAAERESFCQNSDIEAKIGYDEGEWCEENYADYYARQEMVKYENQATVPG